MSFVSYAQNQEDVMLWRALKSIEGGFYIDVGANDPEIDSVTKAFYDRGWSGINIEPIESHLVRLLAERPRDINLKCAIAEQNGELEIWECGIRGWATLDKTVAQQHENEGYSGRWYNVTVRTLKDICDEFSPGEIHFLKIDVEGFERQVIKSHDWQKYRPWIVLVEATSPNTKDESHFKWEPTLLEADYVFAYSDGINRFYVAKEHLELTAALKHAPNAFDVYQTAREHAAYIRIDIAQRTADEAIQRALNAEQNEAQINQRLLIEIKQKQEAQATAHELSEKLEETTKVLFSIYESSSWKITKPLRVLFGFVRRVILKFR